MVLDARFSEVLSAAAEGADWAWAELYREAAPPLLRFLTAQGARDPEDLLGEVFIDIVRNLGSFSGGEREFRAWTYRIARNRHVDAIRTARRRPVISSRELDDGPDDESRDPAPGAALFEQEAVNAILDTLTADQRAVLLLRFVHQFSAEETAGILGRSSGAIRVLQHRAIQSLRRSLAARGAHHRAPAGSVSDVEAAPGALAL